MNRLLIVESPTKARTISRMLGRDYTIMASMGHVRDLPEHVFGVNIADNFAPQYVDSARSAKIVRELRAAAKKADEIYLAPDPDREGEAIAWHLSEVLKSVWNKPFHRVTFHEITRSAINRALDNKSSINMNLVDAQQARRVLDRIVGYQVSPLLWSRVEKGISAGRVQSVALRLVVEREREITGFTAEEYWVFSLVFRADDGREFACKLFKIDGKDFRITNGTDAESLLNAVLSGSAPAVRSVSVIERRRNAPPPFTTSTMQQAASNACHFSATNTMRYAQQLYEGVDVGEGGSSGLITYMRTDSVTVAREAQEAARAFIRDNYGADYCPDRPNYFKNKAAAQEAHEAIRPTDITRTPEKVAPYLEPELLKLYTLIWRRFTASQMSQSIQNLTAVDVAVKGSDGHDYAFRATAAVPVFAGFSAVYGEEKRRDDSENAAVLGARREGDILSIADSVREQKFTEPPPRYSEAALIKELEENGIGRPSTYAAILRTVQQRNYVSREQGRLVPTELGFRVCDFLVGHLPELFNVRFTADMENRLDDVEAGSVAWTQMMRDFYSKFAPWLEQAKNSDAPPPEYVSALLSQLSGVEFAPAEKRGSRTYSDSKFFKSIQEAFEKSGRISRRQYQVLLDLAARYVSKVDRSVFAREVNCDLDSAIEAAEARRKKAEETALPEEQKADYARLFDAFANVKWEEPVTRRGRVYDDCKFFTSLKKQVSSGKIMSDKQLAALGRIAQKYISGISDGEFVMSMLNISGNTEPSAEDNASGANTEALLKELSQVTAWAEPVKRGRRTYSDKDFYESLASQYESRRKLSSKQVAALEKIAAKYRNGGGAPSDSAVGTAAEAAPESAADISSDMAFLASVTEWEPPVKKGRFTMDDKKFFASLKSQYDTGKKLSPKQTAALSKLAEKYKK